MSVLNNILGKNSNKRRVQAARGRFLIPVDACAEACGKLSRQANNNATAKLLEAYDEIFKELLRPVNNDIEQWIEMSDDEMDEDTIDDIEYRIKKAKEIARVIGRF